jgi:hypothetical protein
MTARLLLGAVLFALAVCDVIAASPTTTEKPDCGTEHRLRECLNHIQSIEQENHWETIQDYTRAQLDKICDDLNKTTVCLKNEKCEVRDSVHLTDHWSGAIDSHKFLCSHKTLYLNHTACWKEAAVQAKMKTCNSNFKNVLRQAHNTTAATKAEHCKGAKENIHCMEQAVDMAPCKNARWFIHGYTRESFDEVYGKQGCRLSAAAILSNLLLLVFCALLATIKL